ncbi:MAG TPA: hypothetical protein VFG77_03020 [Nitrososphaeraceae archaeon]|nr:hypothetical protein [Nitrososphaeraceae archaeon]
MVKLIKNGRLLDCPENILPFSIRSSVLTAEQVCNPVVFAKEHKAMLPIAKNYWNI